MYDHTYQHYEISQFFFDITLQNKSILWVESSTFNNCGGNIFQKVKIE